MTSKRVGIIGGVAGGASTAARLRRLDENIEIIIFERGPDISYANCGIPYHIGEVIKERGELVVISKEDFADMFKVDVRVLSEVIAIDRAKKVIKIKDRANNNIYEERYDNLVLSPGGQPIRPPLPGINDSRIFTIRNLQDMDSIKGYIKAKNPRKAIIVGAGFIGLEMAENLHHLGMMVSIVELSEHVMNVLDIEMAAAVHQHLRVKNIELYLKDGVASFVKQGDRLRAILQSGRAIEADLVILAIGIKPEVELAKAAGLTIGERGGIKVNAHLLTNDPLIYALGDATEIRDCVSGDYSLIPLANAANKQGRIVADNLCGIASTYKGTPATAIAKVFDLSVAIVGNNEKGLQRTNRAFRTVYLIPSSHAGYYPGATPLIFKLLYCPDSEKVLGAQIIGHEGVDKRIDVLATAIQQQLTIRDLAELELAYAPPYSSAKDPVNLAGMIAINQVQGLNPVINWNQVEEYQAKGALLVDVRTPMEYQLGHIAGAINIPLPEIRERAAKEIGRDKPVIVYCYQGKTAYFSLSILRNLGYKNIYNLNGGYKIYRTTRRKQENVGIFEQDFIDKREEIHQVTATDGQLVEIDARGLQCPGPLSKLAKAIKEQAVGHIIIIRATDPGFAIDVKSWARQTGHHLIDVQNDGTTITARLQKQALATAGPNPALSEPKDGQTIVVFSEDLDKLIASFIIANGAVAMGKKVTMFFTFWGLTALRKRKAPGKIKKNWLERIFGIMLPKGSTKLPLSRLHMAGIGPRLIRTLMQRKNVDSLEEMIRQAQENEVKIVACQMSMDLLGFKRQELLEGIEIAGVATYLAATENASANLFI